MRKICHMFVVMILCLLAAITSADAADRSDDALPRVLLIGDSISRGYRKAVTEELKAVAKVSHHSVGTTGSFLEKIDQILADDYEVIHFNVGLHDLCYRHPDSKVYGNRDKVKGKLSTTLEQYETNLNQIVSKLKESGATLIWANTTIVPEGEVGRFVGDDVKYNAVAAKVMKAHGVKINDLHALTKAFDADHFVAPGDVHYKPQASAKIARQVARAIRIELEDNQDEDDTPPAREDFKVTERNAFVIEPPKSARIKGPMPWVWYAPTLGHRHPNRDEQWMINRFHANGIAIAGIDVGESFGSPEGRAAYQALYEELTTKRGYSKKPVLLARSRGGLMLYGWAVEHPESVGAIAGIYPVCNIASYPGIARAAPAYGLTPEELERDLKQHNPIDRLEALANAKVPIRHIQGDSDNVVPHEKNSALLAERYRQLGGTVEIELIEGQGHNMWRGWFESDRLTNFAIDHALGRKAKEGTMKIEAGKDVTLTGKLRGELIAIGGETTGWQLAYESNGRPARIEVDVRAIKNAEQYADAAVNVTGTIIKKNYIERGPVLILKATKIERASD